MTHKRDVISYLWKEGFAEAETLLLEAMKS